MNGLKMILFLVFQEMKYGHKKKSLIEKGLLLHSNFDLRNYLIN